MNMDSQVKKQEEPISISSNDIVKLSDTAFFTLTEIEQEASGLQYGLYSRFPNLNAAVLKYFRFGNIYAIGGPSSHGKSYLSNHLLFDFTDRTKIVVPLSKIKDHIADYILQHGMFTEEKGHLVHHPINESFNVPTITIYCGYEVDFTKENVRTLSALTGFGYDYILSSKVNEEIRKTKKIYEYNQLTDDELTASKTVLEAYLSTRKSTFFVKRPQKMSQLHNYCKTIYQYYKQKRPDVKLILFIDHILLSVAERPQDESFKMMNSAIKTLMDIRADCNALIVPLYQFNSDIESPARTTNPALHIPIKSDIYMGGQFYQGCDFIFGAMMPEKLGITKFLPKGYPTENLFFMQLMKARFGQTGGINLYNDLAHGKFKRAELGRNAKDELAWLPL